MCYSTLPRCSRVLALALFVLLACSVAARAADGRIEINQTCAAAGCFANDAPGFPVTISDAGSYLLTSNLQVSEIGTTAVEILASDVTLDLNGFKIQGVYSCGTNPTDCDPGRGAGSGIFGSNSAYGVRVRNGTVQRFGGSLVDLGAFGRIEDLRAQITGSSAVVVGVGGLVRNCQVENVRQNGVYVFTRGFGVTDGLVEGNLIRDIRGNGIEMSGGFAVGNLVFNTSPSAKFSSLTGYSQNRFFDSPLDGISTGDNVCGATTC